MNTLRVSAENLIEIISLVSETWLGKVKDRGPVYSSRRIYSAKYGISALISEVVVQIVNKVYLT